jgi:hypothetical protein
MGKPGGGIKKVVKKYAETFTIMDNAQEGGTYNDDGDFVRGARDPQTIKLHWQPLSGKEALNLPENLRSKSVYNYWTLEGDKIDLKNQVIIGDKIFTIETIKEYSLSHTEGMMSRSGTQQNIDAS